MTVALIISGLFFALAGIISCLLPVLPGPLLSYLGLLILSYARNWEPFTTTFLLVMGALALVASILDSFLSAIGARRYGASKWGILGSIAGIVVGLFFIPPWGMVLGAIGGAFLGEVMAGKAAREALRAGWGVFLGNLMGVVLKLVYTGALLFIYIREISSKGG